MVTGSDGMSTSRSPFDPLSEAGDRVSELESRDWQFDGRDLELESRDREFDGRFQE